MRTFITAAALLAGAISPAALGQPVADGAATASGEIDPARLAAARQTIGYIFPAGTYAKLMNGTMNGMMQQMQASVSRLPLRTLVGTALGPQDLARLGDTSLAEIMAIVDPAYEQRTKIMTTALLREVTAQMTAFEPQFRDGLVRAYARRFTVAQLAELNTFFATPTGGLYASSVITISTDPEVMARLQAFTPQLIAAMPAIMTRAQAETASLPKPKAFGDLSAEERTRLARLLGVSEEDLAKPQKP